MMGTFKVVVRVFNWEEPERSRELEMLVDTGASRSILPLALAVELGIRPDRRRKFLVADGREVARDLGWAGIEYGGEAVHSLVVIGEVRDPPVLGASTLEDLVLQVDPVRRVLRPAQEYLLAEA